MIRIWKLGSLEHKVLPTKEAAEMLTKFLEMHEKGTVEDLIWGPDIDVQIIPDSDDENIDVLFPDLERIVIIRDRRENE